MHGRLSATAQMCFEKFVAFADKAVVSPSEVRADSVAFTLNRNRMGGFVHC